jgi:MYXO-CTERM domain-containing protein
MADPIISVRDLVVSYGGRRVLDGVNLDILGRRERALAQLVHAVGLADEPLFAGTDRAPAMEVEPRGVSPNGAPARWVPAVLALAVLGVAGFFVLRRRSAR